MRVIIVSFAAMNRWASASAAAPGVSFASRPGILQARGAGTSAPPPARRRVIALNHKGFIGSFAISALLVSAAVALLVVTGAMLAFDGFPGPSVDDSTEGVRAVSLATGARPKPELVLDPPSASALDESVGAKGADVSVAAEAASGASVATPDAAGAPATPAVAPPETAVPPAPPSDPTAPALPGGGAADDPTEAIESSIDGLPPVTEGIDEVVGGAVDGGRSLP